MLSSHGHHLVWTIYVANKYKTQIMAAVLVRSHIKCTPSCIYYIQKMVYKTSPHLHWQNPQLASLALIPCNLVVIAGFVGIWEVYYSIYWTCLFLPREKRALALLAWLGH